MNVQAKGGNGSHMQEVLTAVTDFARLAQRSGEVSATTSDSVAASLLERLLRLCHAESGALVMTRDEPTETVPLALPTSLQTTSFRTFALSKASEKEVLNLLPGFSETGGDVQLLSKSPCWVGWQLSISTPALFHVSSVSIPLAVKRSNRLPQAQAFFLFNWENGQTVDPAALEAESREVLTQVADAVRNVLVSLLLSERVYHLETSIESKVELLKSELLATVNHELRSPLTAIKGYTATLLHHEHRISREERREFLHEIHDASRRMEVLIERLLELSQLETGGFSLKYTVVDLTHLVREAITAIEQRLGKPASEEDGQPEAEPDIEHFPELRLHIEEHFEHLKSDGLLIYADRQRLREVLDNLLENAIVYSPEGGVVEIGIRPYNRQPGVKVSEETSASCQPVESDVESRLARVKLDKGPLIEIWVNDHGLGIPPEHIEHIFERFYRVDTRLTREVNGLGLGLAICKRIVELHEGAIWAESQPGEGSTFHVLLPASGSFSTLVQMDNVRSM